ncbi:MAG: hypothetical protein KAI53_04895 [Candidatus Aenigmarchaeota archaeon]|nr:hypothetical protein [Candidatus Aenigmarchaeota archaeon]
MEKGYTLNTPKELFEIDESILKHFAKRVTQGYNDKNRLMWYSDIYFDEPSAEVYRNTPLGLCERTIIDGYYSLLEEQCNGESSGNNIAMDGELFGELFKRIFIVQNYVSMKFSENSSRYLKMNENKIFNELKKEIDVLNEQSIIQLKDIAQKDETLKNPALSNLVQFYKEVIFNATEQLTSENILENVRMCKQLRKTAPVTKQEIVDAFEAYPYFIPDTAS